MKISRLETHDRYQEFTKKELDISECCQDLINKRPFGDHAFYIFAHTRTHEDGVSKRLIWQPRLTKPRAETNSMLFKAYPNTDIVKVIWMIPDPNLWGQYIKGNICHNETVLNSINDYRFNRSKLNKKEVDDMEDFQIDAIYQSIARDAQSKKATQGNEVLTSCLSTADPCS